MKKVFLKFPHRPVNYAPKIVSRRFRLDDLFRGGTAYKSDGGKPGGEDDDDDDDDDAGGTDENKLLQKIQKRVKREVEKRGGTNAQVVDTMIKKALEGLNVEALRAFDVKKSTDSITAVATEVEKMKQNWQKRGSEKLNALKALIEDEKTLDAIRVAMQKDSGKQVVLNVRAAVPVMTLDNTAPTETVPVDILNNFQIDAFVKRRYPNEFIFDIASRITMAEIPEYITWMEEGTEDGAFALVTEGAVKPLVSKTLIRNVSKYQKVAGKRVYTEEFAKFRKESYRILEELFNDQLLRNYAAILVTNLNTKAASYVGTALDAQYANPTDYHAVGAVAAQIESVNFNPDLIILNPQDKWRIALEQNTQGTFYVNIPTYDPAGGVRMMGFMVVTSNRVPVGTFYLGESRLYKIVDEAVTVRLGYGINVTTATVSATTVVVAVDSDIDTNRFRIIAETFFHNYIATNMAGSFVKATWAAMKTALHS